MRQQPGPPRPPQRKLRIAGSLLALLALLQLPAQANPPQLLPGAKAALPTLKPPLTALAAVTASPTGHWALLESGSQRIVLLDREGRALEQAGGFGYGDGATVAASDLLYVGFDLWVLDPAGGAVVRYDRRLTPLRPLTGVLERGRELAFDRPSSAARFVSGDIALLEGERRELLLLDPQGRLIERVASFAESELIAPLRLEASAAGMLAIADPGAGLVHLFDRFGSPLGRRPWPLGEGGPTGLAWQGGRLWACGPGGLALWEGRELIASWPADLLPVPARDIALDGARLLLAGRDGLAWMTIVEPE